MSIIVESVSSSAAHPHPRIEVELSDRPLPARMRLDAARTSLHVPSLQADHPRRLIVALQTLLLRVLSR